MSCRTSLIILTRNEIEGMRYMIDKIPYDFVDESFVVDYQSSDGTVEFLKKHGIITINQERPGRGEAFRIAAETASGDSLVFFSPDGNENPADIPQLLEKLAQGYDMVVASRFLPGSRNEEDDQLIKLRAWANRTFTFVANLLWNRSGKYITDTINGYRAISKDAFNRLNISAQGYEVEYQMSIRAMRMGLKIAEIPTIEGNRIGGKSKAKAVSTGLRFLKLLARELFHTVD